MNKVDSILLQINNHTKLGDLRKIAKDIKRDHELAMELWSTGDFLPRLLAILIMDKTLITQDLLDKLDRDMHIHTFEERNNLMDWLMANQLTKDKKMVAWMEGWQHSPSALQRRAFWYYKARLRWMGQTPPDNNADLLSAIEAAISQEEPEVQWAMNFTAGWIGVYDPANRARCIKLGEETGLYRGDMVSKGCTPNYLPEFIAIEVNKRNNK
ncbi:DNA alkylation repair protein [Paenibacillus sp. PL2-23]|uniref:DNA alkylation repair protein n=1 Tax=Paenibacillus sp. PL2-23 TaxID=2100729 RepID=UPI0030FCE62D